MTLKHLTNYPLHLLGWKAFQDLCVSIAEECLRRPVQSFLPVSDAGRDGAFVGRWDGDDPASGESTIQCKFTSNPDVNLTPSMIESELAKAAALVGKGLASDYVILTNHPITGSSELKIRSAFQDVGVGRCRVFGHDWIVRQIQTSPRLRMLAPRLYGLGDLSDLLDARAYAQAQLILSALGEDLERLVVTEAYRRSVRAISEHNIVLLLGAPATGKSTIGASLAIGAADIWKSAAIRATSPRDIQTHLDPGTPQFFWIDDAWGSTQYQRTVTEHWNQVFPLMQGAIKNGTRFLITSRDYIWRAAQQDLKLQALPVLRRSQVVINVQELSTQEKAQILYNHIKLGDQPAAFRQETKAHLGAVAEGTSFLPETARRFGSRFFAKDLPTARSAVLNFFERPQQFLEETISNLSAECRGAIAVVFLNGGKVRSPVEMADILPAASAFDTTVGGIKEQLEALNNSLLLLAKDETGAYWTYKHPTVSDAFARYLAKNAELVEVYLRGARADSILREVVCAGCEIFGAAVIVPDKLHTLLADRVQSVVTWELSSFLSYRSNRAFSELMLRRRPDLLDGMRHFSRPVKEDSDASLAAALHEQGLLPQEQRLALATALRDAALEDADASFLDDTALELLLSEEEKQSILNDVETRVFGRIGEHVNRIEEAWDRDYQPDDVFEDLKRSFRLFADAISWRGDFEGALTIANEKISYAIERMNERYEPSSSTAAPTQQSSPASAALQLIFRDIDE